MNNNPNLNNELLEEQPLPEMVPQEAPQSVPVESLEPVQQEIPEIAPPLEPTVPTEIMEPVVTPDPIPVAPEPVSVAPAPVKELAQPVEAPLPEPQPVTAEPPIEQETPAPSTHVDLNNLTPRTELFGTSAEGKSAALEQAKEKEKEKQKEKEKAQPKEKDGQKSVAFPLIMILLIIGGAGYFIFNNFNTPQDSYPAETPENNKNNYVNYGDDTEEDKEDKEETKETTEKETTKEETTKTEEQTPTETPVEKPADTQTPEAKPTSNAVEMISGAVLYLYKDGSTGMNGVNFEYLSNTDSVIEVNVSINEGTAKKYVIPFGKKTDIENLKNQITITKESDDQFAIEFA